MGKFINDKLGELNESLGFDFMEMAELAQNNPEEFLRRKKEIFRHHFPDLGDEELDVVLAKLNLTPEEGGDEPLDTVVANLVRGSTLISSAQGGIVEIVRKGSEAVNQEAEKISENCQTIQAVGEKIIKDCQGTEWHLREINDNLEKTSEGIKKIDENLATKEAARIPEEKKH